MERLKAHEALEVDGENVDEKLYKNKYFPNYHRSDIYFIVLYCSERVVFCKPFLDKVAKHFWTLLHVQIGQSCKALVSLIK